MSDEAKAVEQAFPSLIPDGTVFSHGIVVVEVLDAEGDQQSFYQTLGEPFDTQTIGLLEWTKLDIFTKWAEEEEGDRDAEG